MPHNFLQRIQSLFHNNWFLHLLACKPPVDCLFIDKAPAYQVFNVGDMAQFWERNQKANKFCIYSTVDSQVESKHVSAAASTHFEQR